MACAFITTNMDSLVASALSLSLFPVASQMEDGDGGWLREIVNRKGHEGARRLQLFLRAPSCPLWFTIFANCADYQSSGRSCTGMTPLDTAKCRLETRNWKLRVYESGKLMPCPALLPRTGHLKLSLAKAPAPSDFAAHRDPHLERGRRAERGRKSLPPGLQYISDLFVQPAAVGRRLN